MVSMHRNTTYALNKDKFIISLIGDSDSTY
jgi:hypothetical protein